MKKLILICAFFCFACHKAPKTEKQNDFQAIAQTKTVKLREYRLAVASTFIKDSLDASSSQYSYPLFLKQTIKIYKKDKLILQRNHIATKISVLTYHGQKLDILENRITEAGIIDKAQGVAFYINGWGGCTDCSTYLELIDEQGKTLYLDYSDKFKVFKSIGNFQQVLKANGIPYETIRTASFPKTKI